MSQAPVRRVGHPRSAEPHRGPHPQHRFARNGAWLLVAAVVGTGSCYKQSYPLKETHPVTIAPQCLLPEQPMVPLSAGPDGGFPTQACIDRARQTLAGMSLYEKLGQMMQPDRGTVRESGHVAQFGFGSILSGGGSAPLVNTPLGWTRMVNEFREHSLAARVPVPVIYGIDAVHGHNNVSNAVIFPHNVGLGATRDAELVERIGRVTAREVAATNIDWTFAPVLAAARDERWGRTYEAFGETPELAELLGPALIRGLQGERLGKEPHSVLACAKHYIGDGNTLLGKDQGDSPISREQIETELLPAYRKAIDAGVGSVMVSYSSIDGIKMHCHGPLLNDTLKGGLGFRGFVVSDWEAVEKLPGNYQTQLASALNAGVDMVMNPKSYTGFITAGASLVPDRVPQSRIDDAVTRILTVKCELGMLEADRYQRDRSGQLATDAELLGAFGGEEHRLVAREAVSKSLVLLENEGSLLPLSKQLDRVVLAGKAADDVGRQCGGWTLSWQGQTGDITEGTSVREAFEAVLTPERVSVVTEGEPVPPASVGVVVIVELPYAEFNGDRDDLTLREEDVRAVEQLDAAGLPVVVILVTGRPLILGRVQELADAIVVAWLPGTEGAGITDVLFGDRPFTGKLPHSWPRSMEQVPINVGDAVYDPLFPYGFGLETATSPAKEAPAPGPSQPQASDTPPARAADPEGPTPRPDPPLPPAPDAVP